MRGARTRRRRWMATVVGVAVLTVASPHGVAAQAGAATDVIVGRVTDSSGAPIDHAAVSAVAVATGRQRNALTGTDGRYVLVFADGGGRYVLRARRLGFAPATVALERRPETDRLTADLTLAPVAATLQTVTVTSPTIPGDSAGAMDGTGRILTPNAITRLPIDAAGDLNALAALAPGVVGINATDTSAAAFSVGGQRPTQNHVSLDGLTFGPGSVPRDAVRETKIVTSTYDVSKGQFSGGEVASSTRSGTNTLQTSLSYDLQSQPLEVGAAPSPAFSREYDLNRLSGSAGGALVQSRLFAFGAVEFSRRTNPLATLLSTDPLTDERLGVSPDTVQRFLGLVSAAGLPLLPQDVPRHQTRTNAAALARLDYVIDDANHFTLRADWHGANGAGTRASPRGLLTYLGEDGSQGGGLLAGLTTQAGTLTNDARITEQLDYRRANGFGFLPRGRVFISSIAPDGLPSTIDVSVGGNQDFPWTAQSQLLEGGDEIAILSRDASHRVKLGVLANYSTARTDSIEEKDGVFLYNSLADFAANKPASFERILGAGPRNSARTGAAVYAGDAWRPRSGLEIDYGVRLEGSWYGDGPTANPAVATLFGVHTDRFPSEIHASPRLGFTYAAGGDEADRGGLRLRGGIGEFRGTIPPFLFALAAQSTGLASGQILLSCTGSGVPAPDWRAYMASSRSIPSTCAGGASGVSAALPSVQVFAPGAAAPRVWRASLGASRRILGPISATVDLFYIRGVSQIGLPDRNLRNAPQFVLATEGGRPVYAPASSIDPATGAVPLVASRLYPAFGTVFEARSNLQSETRQATVGLHAETKRRVDVELSYTYSGVRDQSLGFDGESADGTTAGNPNRPVWGRADDERHHQFLATVAYPLSHVIELTAIGRLVSGSPFTPGVAQDINGDGQRNDRAFVFDPAGTTDTATANGMRRLLAAGPPTARSCLPSQFGHVAGRNSCTGPWVPGLDFKLNVTPGGRLARTMTISVVAMNTLVGIDELLHGSTHLRGWGQDASVDRRLLFVTGFDPVRQAFHYQVNQHFGAASGTLNAFRIPFVVGLQARIAVGGHSHAPKKDDADEGDD